MLIRKIICIITNVFFTQRLEISKWQPQETRSLVLFDLVLSRDQVWNFKMRAILDLVGICMMVRKLLDDH